MLFLSCGGKIRKTEHQIRKEVVAEKKAEIEQQNLAAKACIFSEKMRWYHLPNTRAAVQLLRWFTPYFSRSRQTVWKELYVRRHYPENYYETRPQTRPKTVAQYR